MTYSPVSLVALQGFWVNSNKGNTMTHSVPTPAKEQNPRWPEANPHSKRQLIKAGKINRKGKKK